MGRNKTIDFLSKASLAPVVVLLVFFLSSCTHRMVCPAYQSAFIFDTTALKQKFSLFDNDTPRIYEVNKNKFLIVEPLSYRKQMASFRTIEMLPIYPVIPDSLKFQGDAMMDQEKDSVVMTDSTGAVISSAPSEEEEQLHPGLIGPKFNVEQENYMYYFRRILVLPDVRAGISNQKPPKKGFFARLKDKIRNIFKRKKKKNAEAESDSANAPEEKEKKPFFDRFKKNKQAETDLGDENQEDNVPPPVSNPPDSSGFELIYR